MCVGPKPIFTLARLACQKIVAVHKEAIFVSKLFCRGRCQCCVPECTPNTLNLEWLVIFLAEVLHIRNICATELLDAASLTGV